MVNLAEVFVANGIGILLMAFLLLTRKENKENRRLGEWLFDAMLWIIISACLSETISFYIDGRQFFLDRFFSYAVNNITFLCSNMIGCLWCFYVDFRIYHSSARLKKQLPIIIPLIITACLLVINSFGTNVVFSISDTNVYIRGNLIIILYVCLFFYYFYSVILIIKSRSKGVRVKFFPIGYFIIPCITGTLLQVTFYGLATGWLSVSISLLFVYIQLQNENSFVDSLTGLYNRKYLDYMLSVINKSTGKSFYGMMIDMDKFKQINDVYGHDTGDKAIRDVGHILTKVVPENGVALRYAGDEFIIIVETEDKSVVARLKEDINKESSLFNQHSNKPYKLHFSTGTSFYDHKNGSTDAFLREMDQNMYEEKRAKQEFK